MPMSEKSFKARDAKRDIGEELLASVLEMKARKAGKVHKIPLSEVTQARAKSFEADAVVRRTAPLDHKRTKKN